MRRLLLVVTAIGTLLEGVVLVGTLLAVSAVIGRASMSMDGSDPRQAQGALRIVAVVLAVGFLVLGTLLMVVAVRNGPLRGATRAIVIVAAVAQWFLAIVTGVAMSKWLFAGVLVLCGCLLGVLFMRHPERQPERPVDAPAGHRAT